MTVDGTAGRYSPSEELLPAGQVLLAESLDHIDLIGGQHSACGCPQLGQVCLPQAENGGRSAVAVDGRPPLGVAVKHGQGGGDPIDLPAQVRVVCCDQDGQAPFVRKAAHDHYRLCLSVRLAEAADTLVHVGRQPAVEFNFGPARPDPADSSRRSTKPNRTGFLIL